MTVFNSIYRKLFSPSVDLEDIEQWRRHILSIILLVVVVLGSVVTVPSVLAALHFRLWAVAIIDVITLAWVTTIWRMQSLSFNMRAWNFCALLYFVGLALVFTLGLESQIYLMAFPVMAALLLGPRPALYALALNAVTLLGAGYLAGSNLHFAGTEGQSFLAWIVTTINFTFVSSFITISSVVVLYGLETMLERMRDSEELYRATFENSPIGVSRLDLEGRWLLVNNKFCEITGYSQSEMLRLTDKEITHPDDIGSDVASSVKLIGREIHSLDREKRYIGKSGNAVWVNLRTSLVRASSGEPKYFVSVITDITERKQSEDQIRELAFYDPLTKLPNRRLLYDRLKYALVASARNGRQGVIMLIDLDNFKKLNDTQGHDVGDRLLIEAAQRMQSLVRQSDTVARLGGDEFLVLLEDLQADGLAASQAMDVAEKILAALDQPYHLEVGTEFDKHAIIDYRCTASIGITMFGAQHKNTDELLKQADLAMYQAKESGRNAICFFDLDMQANVDAKVALERELRDGIQNGQLRLHYQAQVVGQGHLTGAEALVRWQHPERGMVLPGEFIQLAEESKLILPLGQWVLKAACVQLAAWATVAEMARLTIAVNISAHQFMQGDFVDQVLAVLENTGANPQRLKLELTESLLISNVDDVIEKMFALKVKGVNFSLDDFGTGYSSLSYLKRLPLDQLKIDQSFVNDLLVDSNNAAIARTIVALAASLGLGVIAEGVETEAQRHFLASLGCHAYQGYLFHRPQPVEAFEEFARRIQFLQLGVSE